MTKEMEALIDKYWDDDQHEKIVELILNVPEAERDLDILGQLVVAYNNLGRYDDAIALSMELEERSKELPAWYYRIGYALNGKKDYQSASSYLEDGIRLAYKQMDFSRAKNCFHEFYRCIPYLAPDKKNIAFQEEPLEVVWSPDEHSFKIVKGVVNLGYMGTFLPHQMSLDFDNYSLMDIFEGEYDDSYVVSNYIRKDMSKEEQAQGITTFLNMRLNNIKEHITQINQAFLSYLLLDDMVGCGYPIWEDCKSYILWDKIPEGEEDLDHKIYTTEFCQGTYPLVDKYYRKPMNSEIDNSTPVEDYLVENLPMFDYKKMLLDVHSQYLSLGANSIAIQCDGEGESSRLVCCACAELENDNTFFDWHNH